MDIRYQIQRAIDDRKDDLERLETMMKYAEELKADGWKNPKVYADVVRHLKKVGMCVIHQSLIFDIKRMAEELDDGLPLEKTDGEDERFTKRQLDRILRALDNSYAGIPDNLA